MSQFRIYYDHLYKKIVEDSFKELSPIFVKDFGAKMILSDEYFKEFELIYNEYREELKQDILVGKKISETNEKEQPNLNFSKMCAIVCLSVLKKKPIVFDKKINDDKISKYILKIDQTSRDYESRNQKIVNNLFVNYRIAVNAGLSFLYINYLGKNTDSNADDKIALSKKWNEKMLFSNYSSSDQDTFAQTLIKTLVRLEYQGKDIDPVLLSLIFGSIQELIKEKN